MKRLISLLLSLLLLCGCGLQSRETELAAVQSTHIIVTIPGTPESNLTGLPEVQAAINKITVPEIGVEVELLPIDAVSSSRESPERITKGQQIDLLALSNESVENYVRQELLLPLDELIAKEGSTIRNLSETYVPLLDGGTINGRPYAVGIPAMTKGNCGGLWLNRGLLEEVSFHYEPEKVYSLDELDILFARLKQRYPDKYPLGLITSTYNFSIAVFFLGLYADSLNSSDPACLDYSAGSTRLRNRYEIETYVQLLQTLRKWYEAGYIYPDSAITATTSISLYAAGIVQSVSLVGSPYMLTEELLGEGLVCMRLSPIRYTRSSSVGTYWTVPITSKNPEAAIRFLDFMYRDERINHLLSSGIEGRDYTLEGGSYVELESRKYYNYLGIFGDQRQCYETNWEERMAVREAYSNKAQPVGLEYTGFVFDHSGLQQELLAIQRVEEQYVKLLETGCVDFDTVYPEFLQKLYEAGLQKVMDEKQRQFDLWLAENQEN